MAFVGCPRAANRRCSRLVNDIPAKPVSGASDRLNNPLQVSPHFPIHQLMCEFAVSYISFYEYHLSWLLKNGLMAQQQLSKLQINTKIIKLSKKSGKTLNSNSLFSLTLGERLMPAGFGAVMVNAGVSFIDSWGFFLTRLLFSLSFKTCGL